MKCELVMVVPLAALLYAVSGYSSPRGFKEWAKPTVTHQETNSVTISDLVHRMVQSAKDRYEAGRIEAADKLLQAALEIDAENAEARYYLRLVQESRRANQLRQTHARSRLWYPTLPPRRVDQ